MSTFCVTGEKKNVDAAVAMLNRLIAEGNSETLAAASGMHHNNGHMHPGPPANNAHGMMPNSHHPDRRGVPGGGIGGGMRGPMPGAELGHRLGRMGSDMSRSEGSPATAPCRSVWSMFYRDKGCFPSFDSGPDAQSSDSDTGSPYGSHTFLK